MAKYRLLAPHYINDVLLGEGAEIGEGTSVPFTGRPSVQMEGLDEAGKKACAARQKSFVPLETAFPVKEPANGRVSA